eukprot:scaffold5460_cov97-Isochrysis_galbana.AAC.3
MPKGHTFNLLDQIFGPLINAMKTEVMATMTDMLDMMHKPPATTAPKDPANRAEPVLLHLPHHRTTCGQCCHAKWAPTSAHNKLTKHVDAALTTSNAPQDATRMHCSDDLGLRACAATGRLLTSKMPQAWRPAEGSPNASRHAAGPQKAGNCALLARPKPASHRSTRCHRCHASGSRRPRPAAKNCAGSRPETRDVWGYRRCGGHAWAAPRTAAAPQVRGAGGRRRKRAGSARTCSIPRLQAPRILRAQAWKYASQPASKPRRSLGAASATAHHNVVGVVALPKEAAHVRDVLAAPP